MHESDTVLIDNGRIRVQRGFLDLLRHHGLDNFNAVMLFSHGLLIRAVPGRSTQRIELPVPGAPLLIAYLKRYEPEYLSLQRWLLRLLHCPGYDDEAAREWQMLHALRAHGFNTPTPIAVGQSKGFGIVTRSFVMTADIDGGQAADVFWRTHNRSCRRALIAALASLTRQFHTAGFIHKDYYLPHVFVVERDGNLNPFLIDLQRVMGPAQFRHRWIIKDIGALAFSAERAGISHTDMLRFYQKYSRVSRLKADDKKLIRIIWKRVARIRRHTPRYGESPILSPPSAGGQTS
jgi:tRNA A-37 threonylcarbamoyl transferase component Bud32